MTGSVLIIEDDPTFAEGAQAALKGVGFQVWLSYDSTMAPIRDHHPDVVVLGALLSEDRSGFGLSSRIRRDPMLKGVSVIIVSGPSEAEAAERHRESADAADAYVTKDQPLADLVRIVKKLTGFTKKSAKGGPPPLSRSTAAPGKPPSLPGKSHSTASLPSPAAPTPPLSADSDALSELWPQERYDMSLQLEKPPSAPLGSTGRSLEERLNYLRTQVNQLESDRRSFMDIWTQASRRGQDLARRVQNLTARADQAERKLASAEERNEEFRRFDEKVRQIAAEKDVEERERKQRLETLKRDNQELSEQLEAADRLHESQMERIRELEDALDDSDHLLQKLRTTEAVAHQRAEQIEVLQGDLDDIRIRQKKQDGQEESQSQALQAENEALKAELTALKAALSDPEGAQRIQSSIDLEEREAYQSREAELQHQIEHLEALRSRSEERLSQVEHELSMIQSGMMGGPQSGGLQLKQIAEMEAEQARLEASIRTASETLTAMHTELQEARENEAIVTEDLISLQSTHEELLAAFEASQEALAAERERFARAEDLLRRARQHIEDLESASAEPEPGEDPNPEVRKLARNLARAKAEHEATVLALKAQADQAVSELRAERLERDRLALSLTEVQTEAEQLNQLNERLEGEQARLSIDLVTEREVRSQDEERENQRLIQLENELEEAKEVAFELRAELDAERAKQRCQPGDDSQDPADAAETTGELEALREALKIKTLELERFEDLYEITQHDLKAEQKKRAEAEAVLEATGAASTAKAPEAQTPEAELPAAEAPAPVAPPPRPQSARATPPPIPPPRPVSAPASAAPPPPPAPPPPAPPPPALPAPKRLPGFGELSKPAGLGAAVAPEPVDHADDDDTEKKTQIIDLNKL